jgi:3-phenylpropionate/trans-cinnamate dioxygenase ferredoxin subunit
MAEFVKVAKRSDIQPGDIKSFMVDTEVIAICNVDGEFYVIKDECSHMAYPLSDGILEGETITCAHHGAEFNVRTGEVLSLPAVEPIETFEVKVEGDDIYVLMEDY